MGVMLRRPHAFIVAALSVQTESPLALCDADFVSEVEMCSVHLPPLYGGCSSAITNKRA